MFQPKMCRFSLWFISKEALEPYYFEPSFENDSSKDSEVDNRQIPSQLQVFPFPANFEGCQDQFQSQILGFFRD